MQEEICRNRVTRDRALESWGVSHHDDAALGCENDSIYSTVRTPVEPDDLMP